MVVHVAKLFLARALAGGPIWTQRGHGTHQVAQGQLCSAGCQLRDWALANRALRRDFEALVIEKAETWQSWQRFRVDSRTLHSIVKELGVSKRGGFKKVILEDGSVARDAQQGTAMVVETLRIPAGWVSRDRLLPQIS